MLIELAKRDLETRYGTFEEILYHNGKENVIALIKGWVGSGDNILCRVHSHCISAHVFNSVECDCREQMEMAQSLIEEKGAGIIIWLDQEGKGNGHLALMESNNLKRRDGVLQSEAYEMLGYEADARTYKLAAEVLKVLQVNSIVLLSNSPEKERALMDSGIRISGSIPVILDPGSNHLQRNNYLDKINHGHHIVLNT